jgi:hypothetical protein
MPMAEIHERGGYNMRTSSEAIKSPHRIQLLFLVSIFALFIFPVGCVPAVPVNRPPLDSTVIMLGDSYFAHESEYVANALESLSGKSCRHYYISDTGITAFTPGYGTISIDKQYDSARTVDNNIKIVIMDGGGNDVFNGAPTADIVNAFKALVTRMLDTDGVSHVIFLAYPHLIGSSASWNAAFDAVADAINAQISDSRFHFIDLRPGFGGHPEYYIDDIHPSESGGGAAAGAIWNVLKNL